jgi:hypothetical protein
MKIISLGTAVLLGSAIFGQTIDSASELQTLVNTKSGQSSTVGDKNKTMKITFSDRNLVVQGCAVTLDSMLTTVIWKKEGNKETSIPSDLDPVTFKLSDVDPSTIKVNYRQRERTDYEKKFKLTLTGDIQYYELFSAMRGGQKLVHAKNGDYDRFMIRFRDKTDADRAASVLATLVQGCQA